MKKTFSSKKSAFSLIELSIVLIIIGLLIAGVTGGASLIKSSELRAAMSEARGYAVAVNGFFAQFEALPGDYRTAVNGSGTAGATNGANSRIEYYASDTSGSFNSESVIAWDQLIRTGALDSTLSLTLTAVGTAQVAGTQMPASKIKFAGWHFDYFNDSNFASYTVNGSAKAAASPQNVIVLTGTTLTTSSATETLTNTATATGVTRAGGALIGTDALSIDTKIDDANPVTGKVRGINTGSSGTNTCYTTASAYVTTSNSARVCAISYQVDVNS